MSSKEDSFEESQVYEKGAQPPSGAFEVSSEISTLKKRIEKLETRLAQEKAPEKEKVSRMKEEIKEHIQGLQRTSPSAISLNQRDEVEEISKFSKPQQVASLISLAFEKGLETAVAVAKALDNPAVLDEFHDTLVDRYYEELLKKRIIKQ